MELLDSNTAVTPSYLQCMQIVSMCSLHLWYTSGTYVPGGIHDYASHHSCYWHTAYFGYL